MSSSALYNNVFQAKIGNVQNQADSTSVYSAGVWSFKNSTAVTSVTITDAGAVTLGPSGFTGNHAINGNAYVTAGALSGVEVGSFPGFPEIGIIRLRNNQSNANARDWALRTGVVSFGDFGIRVSNAKNGDPLTAGIETAICTSSGAWTLGPTGKVGNNFNNAHKVNGCVSFSLSNLGPTSNPVFNHADTTTLMVGWNRSDGNQEIDFVKGGASGTSAFSWYVTTSTTAATFLGTVGTTGAWFQGNNSSTWSTTSDRRIKQNIRAVNSCLEKVNGLNPVHFEYIDKPEKVKTGFIAQEFEQILPGHVSDVLCPSEIAELKPELKDEKIKSIDADLIPYLVGAIKELSAKVDFQDREIRRLKGEVVEEPVAPAPVIEPAPAPAVEQPVPQPEVQSQSVLQPEEQSAPQPAPEPEVQPEPTVQSEPVAPSEGV